MSSLGPTDARAFASRLFSVMGILATAGCGANVVFAEDGEVGGAGGTTSDGGSPQGAGGEGAGSEGGVGGTAPFVCDVELAPDQELVYHCIYKDNGVCPAAESPEARSQLSDRLAWDACDKLCCDGERVAQVPCGPDPYATEECCYYAVVEYYSKCMGRPFTVAGEARVAEACEREGWSTANRTRIDGCDEATRAALAESFASNALMEHASVASFARFALDLLALGAPAELVRSAHRAMGDEIRHAELCFDLASRFAGTPLGPSPLDLSSDGERDAASILADVVREGCIGETLAAMVAARSAEQASDPEVRAVLSEIAEDEARHAELAWATIAWALRAGRPAWREAIEAAFALDGAVPPTASAPEGVDQAMWRAAGQLDQRAIDDVYAAGWQHVIVACRRGLRDLTANEA